VDVSSGEEANPSRFDGLADCPLQSALHPCSVPRKTRLTGLLGATPTAFRRATDLGHGNRMATASSGHATRCRYLERADYSDPQEGTIAVPAPPGFRSRRVPPHSADSSC
jgi:hypothetical protein